MRTIQLKIMSRQFWLRREDPEEKDIGKLTKHNYAVVSRICVSRLGVLDSVAPISWGRFKQCKVLSIPRSYSKSINIFAFNLVSSLLS